MTLNYSKKVMQEFLHPKNLGKIENADGIGKVGNPVCGDLLWIYIKVGKRKIKKTGKEIEYIKDIKFQTLGCLPPTEEISVGDGWANIQSINEQKEVLNSNGIKTKVIETYSREYRGELITLIPFVSAFNQFSLTPEHPILCIKREWLDFKRASSKKCNWLRINEKELISKKPDFVKAKDVSIGDYLLFVPENVVEDDASISENVMKILGYYLAEGYAMSNGVLAFSLNKNEQKNISELKDLLFKVTGKSPKERVRRSVNEIYICSREWCKFFVILGGKYATDKRISNKILLLPFEKQWLMIENYIKGDGNLYKRREKDSTTYRANTASRNLAIQLQEILARGKIFASIKKQNRPEIQYIEGRKVSSNPRYEISFKLDKKHKFIHFSDKYILIPVKKIERKVYSGKVYNFQVAQEPNTYLVRGFAVHNCGAAIAVSSMITQLAKNKTLKEAENISNKDIVNELQGLPPIKYHCSLLGADALKLAIKDYKKRKR